MDNIGVLEAADHMNDGVYFTYVGQELVAQAFAFGSSFHKTGNIYKFDHCGSDFF